MQVCFDASEKETDTERARKVALKVCIHMDSDKATR